MVRRTVAAVLLLILLAVVRVEAHGVLLDVGVHGVRPVHLAVGREGVAVRVL